VFVFGAGASVDFGFPTGWQLVERVLSELQVNPTRERFLEYTTFTAAEIDKFLSALDASGQNSVDAFLEERRDYLALGKAAISAILIGCENTRQLYKQRDPSRNWLRILLANMRGTTFDDFDENQVSFITFNYDRSLEYFLCSALAETFNRTEAAAGSIISKIPIIHLHGRLGYLPWQHANYKTQKAYHTHGAIHRAFQPNLNREAIEVCVRELKIMNIDADRRLFHEAKELLRRATNIYFLGVGLGNPNLERLEVRKLADNKALSTGVGLGRKELLELSKFYSPKVEILNEVDCVEMLKNHVQWN
jgi:hypothetical protein